VQVPHYCLWIISCLLSLDTLVYLHHEICILKTSWKHLQMMGF
jgi:hypothetical protein